MWNYKTSEIKAIADFVFIDEPYGFIYLITNVNTGKFYIGRKNFFSNTKKKFTKKELAAVKDKRLKTYKQVSKESNWLTYDSSSDELKADMLTMGRDSFKKEILEIAFSKKTLGYLELKYMFVFNALERESYNDNIAGKYFRRDLKTF